MSARRARQMIAAVVLVGIALSVARVRTADTLPVQLSDQAFWKLIDDLSERGGAFQSENFLSNETGFQAVIPRLLQLTTPNGVYLGVGPEQNFTYIAALRPKIAFITDIRRQNMIEHVMYKALFRMAPNRADFLARLFSRSRPAGLDDTSTVDELFRAYARMPSDDEAFAKNLQEMKDLLPSDDGLQFTEEDQAALEHVYAVFHQYGPDLNYNSGARSGGFGRGGGMPNYAELMMASDRQGEKRSYLASEENYRVVRDLERRNLIVPLTGDFGGEKTVRAVARYLKDHDATVTAFYLSNVERYLFQVTGNQNGGWRRFYANVAALPLDASSTFIRSVSGGSRGGGFGMRSPNVLASMPETLAAVDDGAIRTYDDVFTLSR
jgi:hypothetical protein